MIISLLGSAISCDTDTKDTTATATPGGKQDGMGPSACSTPAPLCLSSCDQGDVIAVASCDSGAWRCSRGVRESICCDPIEAPRYCARWEHSCSTQRACVPGYTCVKSRTHPVPASTGLCRLGDFEMPEEIASCRRTGLTPAMMVEMLSSGPAKLEGTLVVETECEGKSCPSYDPCCQRCTGSYQLDLGITSQFGTPLRIPIRTDTIACQGNNCGFDCSPMQPGRRYRIWGTFITSDGLHGTLYHLAHCPI